MIYIGKIISSHGIKGHVKVISFAHNPEDIFKYELFNKYGRNLFLKRIANSKNDIFICSIENIKTPEEAKLILQTEIYIKELPKLNENEFYEIDLIGKKVFCNGEEIGYVKNVLNIKNIKNCFLEIEIDGFNHLIEFKESNFPNNEKSDLNIEETVLEKLRSIK